jgi:hypothetical protein
VDGTLVVLDGVPDDVVVLPDEVLVPPDDVVVPPDEVVVPPDEVVVPPDEVVVPPDEVVVPPDEVVVPPDEVVVPPDVVVPVDVLPVDVVPEDAVAVDEVAPSGEVAAGDSPPAHPTMITEAAAAAAAVKVERIVMEIAASCRSWRIPVEVYKMARRAICGRIIGAVGLLGKLSVMTDRSRKQTSKELGTGQCKKPRTRPAARAKLAPATPRCVLTCLIKRPAGRGLFHRRLNGLPRCPR